MKYDAVIYDWNGTLIDDVKACHSILCRLLSEYGLTPVSFDAYREAFTFPVIDYYKKVGFELDKYSFEEVAAKYVPMYDEAFSKCKLYAGAKTLLQKLNSLGVKQYLLSATQYDSLIEQTDFFGITALFNKIVGTNNFHGKSKIEEGKGLMKAENLHDKSVLLIGDTHYDFEVAQKLGVDCALVDFGHKPKYFLKKFTDKVFSSYSEISKFLLV